MIDKDYFLRVAKRFLVAAALVLAFGVAISASLGPDSPEGFFEAIAGGAILLGVLSLGSFILAAMSSGKRESPRRASVAAPQSDVSPEGSGVFWKVVALVGGIGGAITILSALNGGC